jgi:hypothetical protein
MAGKGLCNNDGGERKRIEMEAEAGSWKSIW